jgi:RecB family exonuclease
MAVITPRRTRLVRVPDLRGFRLAIHELAGGSSSCLIVVPTRSAARQLITPFSPAARLFLSVTRDELYDHLHARLPGAPRRLTAVERDVILQASARSARARSDFRVRLRPGLIAETLRLYDHLRRQSQSVARFEELLGDALGDVDFDRGAVRMRQQTRFLADTFREYERRVHESGGCDEHGLRGHLMTEASPNPVRHVIVTVADWIADADGLFVADFDLLSRIPRLESLDIIATQTLLETGFHERLHTWWPGLEESAFEINRPPTASNLPVLITPPDTASDELWWTHRDREEELVAIARHLKFDRRTGEQVPLDRVAVVFARPLPYLYLAAEVFGSAGIAYQTRDTLPLATEPTSAALDVILEAVSSGFTRGATIALLRSPHLRFDGELSRESIALLDRALSAARYLGDPARLEALAETWTDSESAPALRAAMQAARELAPLAVEAPASAAIACLAAFWQRHLQPLDANDPVLAARERRARAAIAETLETLRAAHAAHDDPSWGIEDLALAVHSLIEDQTFDAEDPTDRGLQLVDDKAVRYGEFDDVTVVGLIEPEWPERPRRNIFYPQALLKSLGWPSERDRRAAAAAQFLDLLASPSRRTTLSTFTLEEDALVSRSLLLDEVPRARLSTVRHAALPESRVFLDEALSLDPVALTTLDSGAREWAALRLSRTASEAPRFHGVVPAPPSRTWSVSALETYLGCPFRFFAQHVLKLEEEAADEEVMDPRRQGQFVHHVFEAFFARWQHKGYGAIAAGNLDEAREVFAEVVDEALARLPDAEAGLERTRLLGSPAAAGLGEAVIRMEAERPVPVVERLLEHQLNGEFTFTTPGGPRKVALRGKADRLDLLADGTFRLIDYKMGWPPDRRKALQLPIYSLCAEQWLRANRGGEWTVSEAAYLAFKGPRRVVPLFQNDADRDNVLAEAQERLVRTVEAIAEGQFPPTPDDVYRCETCGFATVCRKDYVGDV